MSYVLWLSFLSHVCTSSLCAPDVSTLFEVCSDKIHKDLLIIEFWLLFLCARPFSQNLLFSRISRHSIDLSSLCSFCFSFSPPFRFHPNSKLFFYATSFLISETHLNSFLFFPQAAKKTADKSKSLLTNIERWQKVCYLVDELK